MKISFIIAAALAFSTSSLASDDCIKLAQLAAPRAMTGATNTADLKAACLRDRNAIEAELKGLRSEIAKTKGELSSLAGLSFRCLDRRYSVNNKGVKEDCAPNACDAASGRCVLSPRSTDECYDANFDSTTGLCVPR